MPGIIERIGSLGGTEAAKAIDLAHRTYTDAIGRHGHGGRAIIETIAEVARNHPNLVGIAVGLLVEQLLVEEKHRYDIHHDANGNLLPAPGAPAEGEPAATDPSHPDHPDHHLHVPTVRLSTLRPGKVAMEVFGALILLKMGSGIARLFRRRDRPEIWFAPAAHIHLISGTLATYYFIKAARAPRISSWRNAAVVLFATDALKPVLRHRPVKGR